MGTLYTAVYQPRSGRAEFRWPGFTLSQSITDFREGRVTIRFPDPTDRTPTLATSQPGETP
jgi:hypothetical protein